MVSTVPLLSSTKPLVNGFLATDDTIGIVLGAMEAADDIAVDTETSGLEVHTGRDYLMGVCIDVPGMAAYIPFRHPQDNVSKQYLPYVHNILKKKHLIWHNRKFDMHSFKTIGIDPLSFTGAQDDTLMIAQLVDEEVPSKELDFLAKRYLKMEKYNKDNIHKFAQAVGYANVPAAMYKDYGPQDAYITRRLRDVLWPKLVQQKLDTVYRRTEEPFTSLLYLLEQRGVGSNLEFATRKAEVGRASMARIIRQLGFDPGSSNTLGSYLLDELKLPILAHTDTCPDCKNGVPLTSHEWKASFKKTVMEDYDDILSASSNPTARYVNAYRGWQKAVTSLYEPLVEKTTPNGRIHTQFKQHGTVTGRLSAVNPNLQQVPRGSNKPWNGDAKSSFNSGKDGYILYGWDYSQVELRLAAAYGQEQILITEFESESADPFNVLAPIIFGVLTPETRFETKTFVYANLYGAGLRKIAAQLGRPMHEVEQLFENYQAGIPGIIKISGQVSSLMERNGYIKYWDGRKRHMRSRSDAYKAWNSLIQGGAAQLVKKAMLRCLEFEDENCQMVLTVHDEITFIIREDLLSHYEPLIIHAMTDWPDFGVNFHVEGKEWK